MAIDTRSDYERGLACVWCDVKVADMTKEKLIEFIGQLDLWIGVLSERNARIAVLDQQVAFLQVACGLACGGLVGVLVALFMRAA